MRVATIVPAFQAATTVGDVVKALVAAGLSRPIVVDDGSTDETGRIAENAGAVVVRHDRNRGKGAALRTGLEVAAGTGVTVAVTLDADGQHPPSEALRIARDLAPDTALVLGARDLAGAGAALSNRFGNAVSDVFLSVFARRRLGDTQCGLRRYPIAQTLALGVRDDGYAFEAEVVLRAARAGWCIVEVPVRVIYPPPAQHTSHFHVIRDPARIVRRVIITLGEGRR